MITSDAGKQRKREREAFKTPRQTERWYAARLREIARHVGAIIRGFPPGDPDSLGPIQIALNAYAEAIDPWARATAARMLLDVSRRDKKAWDSLSMIVGKTLANEIATTPIGDQMRALMAEQVSLIKSLPIEAAQRVHKLTIEGATTSMRAREVAEMIQASSEVAQSRAMLIARTEVARTASTLTQARAAYVGSSGYIWRTSKDASVRPSHRKMEGEFVRWDSKPVLDQMTGHAGEFPNCFSGDTAVSLASGLRHLWRGFHKGQIIDFSVAGQRFSATPNHPILTRRGWRPARLIDQGDDLIQMVGDAEGIIQDHENHRMPSFDELFRAFAGNVDHSAPVEANFHGDVIHGKIDHIAFDDFLPGDRVTPAFQRLGDFEFTDPDVMPSVAALCRCCHIGEPLGARTLDALAAVIEALTRQADHIGFALSPPRNAVALQDVLDRPAVRPEFVGQRKFAHAGLIVSDDLAFRKIKASVRSGASSPRYHEPISPEGLAEIGAMHAQADRNVFQHGARGYRFASVTEKRSRDFAGHVYTMETCTGWYNVSPAMIPSVNCRCWPEVVLPDRFD